VEPWGPYAQGAAPYLDAAIDWARQTGLKVVIDLHGAPKSQNGFDHSGRKSAYPGWGDDDSVSYTHATLRVLEEKYAVPAMQDVVVAIQFLNEPFLMHLDRNRVKNFYRDAYYNLRTISDTPAMLHDGFDNPEWMNGFLTPQDNNAQGVIVDHHEYQMFDTGLVAMSVDQHIGLTCNSVSIKLLISQCVYSLVRRSGTMLRLTSGPVSHTPSTSSFATHCLLTSYQSWANGPVP
jgi:glucan 1,3-beta-glucosidase